MRQLRSPRLKALASLSILGCLLGQAPADQRSAPSPAGARVDPLPSWNDGAVKSSLIRFVEDVSDPSGSKFIPAADRIAVFDSDGTLCVEKPFYFPVLLHARLIRDMAGRRPEWKLNPTLKGIIEDDPEVIGRLHTWDLMTMAFEAHTGITEEDFELRVKAFLDATIHPRFRVPLGRLVYLPMLELIALLKSEGFQVYVCTGGGAGFVRAFSEPAYGISRDHVIGTEVQMTFQLREGGSAVVRLPALVEPLCEKAGKPVNILRHIGRRPILAFGNSDGDIQMLQYAEDPRRPFLSLLLRHDDAGREYAYDARSEAALAMAKDRRWTTVSIKDDFKVVFPPHDQDRPSPVTPTAPRPSPN